MARTYRFVTRRLLRAGIPLTRMLGAMALCACACGCASSGYLLNRGRDAADILTLTLGAGGGAKARVGPLQVAVLDNTDLVGLRTGQWIGNGTDLVDNAESYAPLPLFRDTRWDDPVTSQVFKTGRGKTRDYRSGTVLMHSPEPFTDISALFGREVFSHGPDSAASRRGKDILAASPFPLVSLGQPASRYSQIEVCGGLLLTIRFGFNPGELLDFLLGWGGVDLYDDDAEIW